MYLACDIISLADLARNPQFHGPQVQAGLITLYQAAVSARQAGSRGTAGGERL